MNIARTLGTSSTAHPDVVAVANGLDPVWTYREYAGRVARLAHSLRHNSGLEPGERIAIAMRNCPEFLLVLFAAWHAGLVAVPINARLHRREFGYILGHCGARRCFASADLQSTLAGLPAEIESLDAIVSVDDGAFAAQSSAAAPAMTCAERAYDDPAWIFYTSGTTGRPKGATLTHRNLAFMALAYFADIGPIEPGDAMLHPAALSHGAGLYSLPSIARAGTQVITASESFEPDEVLDLIGGHRNASFFAAPTMLKRLTSAAARSDAGTGNLGTIVYGGGPMYVADLAASLDVFGGKLVQIYGQGESPMTITALGRDEHSEDLLHTCGRARLLVDVRVVDADGVDVAVGEKGEVITRSDCVMAGYWNDPEASARALRGGWLHTGDIGSLDARGYLALKDRANDLVICGGSNIYPREIEEVLLRHPGVLEASVVGRPHRDWGEEVVAFVVARPGAVPDAADLDRHCLDHIARYKRPRGYVFVASLPKNNYGKVLKTELRNQLQREGT